MLQTPIINTLADICSSTPPELFHFVNIPERASYIPAPFEFSVEALQVLVNESPAKSVKLLAAIRSMTDYEEIDELFTAETGHALFMTYSYSIQTDKTDRERERDNLGGFGY